MTKLFKLREEHKAVATNDMGFNGLGKFVFHRSYARMKPDGTKENFRDVITRVVEGAFSAQKKHSIRNGLRWDEEKAQRSAGKMFEHMAKLKFLPAGRGLWMMGTDYVEKKTSMGLFNCAFVSTQNIYQEGSKPFEFLMDVSMLGVGCGFDTRGADKLKIRKNKGDYILYAVPDSREGWVASLGLLLNSYFNGGSPVLFTYHRIRPAGEPIRGFGGTSAGPEPLARLHLEIRSLLERRLEEEEEPTLNSRDITDIMNLIGQCVVSGNVRRSAEIALGDPNDQVFLNLKNYEENPERQGFGGFSNNSVIVSGDPWNVQDIAERIRCNGEPGILFMDNIRRYGRMIDPPNYKDSKASGCNPCGEQTLESYECCNLVEVFLPNLRSLVTPEGLVIDHEEFEEVLKSAYLYAKSVTLYNTHIAESNAVMLRNRRIGIGLSGIAEIVDSHGPDNLREYLSGGYQIVKRYDQVYSDWLCINQSIKLTTVKPSGTVSLVAGTSAGIHYPIGKYYIKRLRIGADNSLVDWAREAGYEIEPDRWTPGIAVISFPVKFKTDIRGRSDISMWEQLNLVSLVQRYWADNQVSCTITFTPEEAKEIETAILYMQDQTKNLSFLPLSTDSYAQMPEEQITQEQYEDAVDRLEQVAPPLPNSGEAVGESGCTTDVCLIR